MAVVEDFLNRLSQHIQAQRDRMDPGKATDPVEAGKFLLQMFAAPARMAADTVGLGLEGTAKLGNYAAGEVVQPIARVQTLLGDPNHPATIAAQKALDAGPLHPQAALDALRNSGDTPTSWLAGALAMSMDPANLIPLPIGEKANAVKGAAAAARKSASFGNTSAGKALIEQLAQQATPAADTAVAQAADPAEAAIQSALARLQQPQDLEAIFRRADRVKNLPDVNAATDFAQQRLDVAPAVYRDVQQGKEAAVKPIARDLLTTVGPRGGKRAIPRGAIGALKDNPTPEYLQAVEDAKNAATPLGPDLPQRGQTYNQFLQPFKARLAQAQAERDDAVGAIRNSLLDTGPSPITSQEADLLSQPVPAGNRDPLAQVNEQFNQAPGGPEYGVGKVDPKWLDPDPKVQAALNNDPRSPLNPANTGSPVHAEIDPNTGKAVVTDRDGWFKAEFDPNNVPRTPLGQEAAAIANPVPPVDPLKKPLLGHVLDLINTAHQAGIVEQKAAFNRPWKNIKFSDVAGVWGAMNIQTLRNLFQDIIYSHFVLSNEDIAKRAMTDNVKLISSRLKAGETQPHLLFGSLGDFMERLGMNVSDPKLADIIRQKIGTSFFDMEADTASHVNELSALQQGLIGGGMTLLSPTRAVTGVLGAPLAVFAPYRQKVFHILNNVTHSSARIAAFEDAFLPYLENSAKDMLQRASAEGMDVSSLVGKGYSRAGDVLATDGMFSPDLVRQALGDRYAMEWQATTNAAFDAGFARSKQVMGNYQLDGALGNAEKQIRKFVPFMSWTWRAYPRAAKYALQHPAVTVGLLHLAQLDREMARQEGRPAYQVGTIGVNKDTPFVGLLASVFTPEQEATARLNPLALFSPVGGELVGAGLENQNPPENLYQDAAQKLSMVGGSFNPLIQTAAYVTGADYKAPGNASRYSPIDQYIGQETGTNVPTVQGPLRALRAGVTKALGNEQVDNYDPVEAKAKELVYERTGQPLEALGPTSQYAKEIAGKTGIYKEAEADYLKGNALRTGFNAVSPTSVTATTKTTEARRAEGSPPFDYNTIQEAKDQGLTTVVKAMQAANDQWYKDHPAAAVNRDAPNANGPQGAKVDPRVAQWEAEHAIMQKVAPRSYAKALADFKASLPKK